MKIGQTYAVYNQYSKKPYLNSYAWLTIIEIDENCIKYIFPLDDNKMAYSVSFRQCKDWLKNDHLVLISAPLIYSLLGIE